MKVIIQTRSQKNGKILYSTSYKEFTEIEDYNISRISLELGNDKLTLIRKNKGWELIDHKIDSFVNQDD